MKYDLWSFSPEKYSDVNHALWGERVNQYGGGECFSLDSNYQVQGDVAV